MKKNNIPQRRCIGCMESKPKQDLIRVAWYEEVLTVDRTGRAKGRGVYLCNSAECFETAKKKKAFHRGFKTNIPQDQVERVFADLEKGLQETDGQK